MGAYASVLSGSSGGLCVDKDIVLVDQRHYSFSSDATITSNGGVDASNGAVSASPTPSLDARPSFLFFVNSLFAHLPDTKKRVVSMALNRYIYCSEPLPVMVEFLELPTANEVPNLSRRPHSPSSLDAIPGLTIFRIRRGNEFLAGIMQYIDISKLSLHPRSTTTKTTASTNSTTATTTDTSCSSSSSSSSTSMIAPATILQGEAATADGAIATTATTSSPSPSPPPPPSSSSLSTVEPPTPGSFSTVVIQGNEIVITTENADAIDLGGGTTVPITPTSTDTTTDSTTTNTSINGDTILSESASLRTKFFQLVADDGLLQSFREFLRQRWCDETLEFYLAVERYRALFNDFDPYSLPETPPASSASVSRGEGGSPALVDREAALLQRRGFDDVWRIDNSEERPADSINTPQRWGPAGAELHASTASSAVSSLKRQEMAREIVSLYLQDNAAKEVTFDDFSLRCPAIDGTAQGVDWSEWSIEQQRALFDQLQKAVLRQILDEQYPKFLAWFSKQKADRAAELVPFAESTSNGSSSSSNTKGALVHVRDNAVQAVHAVEAVLQPHQRSHNVTFTCMAVEFDTEQAINIAIKHLFRIRQLATANSIDAAGGLDGARMQKAEDRGDEEARAKNVAEALISQWTKNLLEVGEELKEGRIGKLDLKVVGEELKEGKIGKLNLKSMFAASSSSSSSGTGGSSSTISSSPSHRRGKYNDLGSSIDDDGNDPSDQQGTQTVLGHNAGDLLDDDDDYDNNCISTESDSGVGELDIRDLVDASMVARIVGYLEKPWSIQYPNEPILSSRDVNALMDRWLSIARRHMIKLKWLELVTIPRYLPNDIVQKERIRLRLDERRSRVTGKIRCIEFWNQPTPEFQGQDISSGVPLWRTRVFLIRDRQSGEVHILRIVNDKLWNVVDREEGDSVRNALPPSLKLLCVQQLVRNYPSSPPWRVLALGPITGETVVPDTTTTTTTNNNHGGSSNNEMDSHELPPNRVVFMIPRDLAADLLSATFRFLIGTGKRHDFNSFALCDFDTIDLSVCIPSTVLASDGGTSGDSSVRRMSAMRQSQLFDALVPELYAIGPTLTNLNLASTNITSRGLKAIASFTPQLLSLDISYCQSYFQWDFLLSLEQLRSLSLECVVGNAQLWSRLCSLPHLCELNLNEAQIQRSELLSYLPRLTNLTLLDIRQHPTRGYFRLDDEVLMAVAKLTHLQTLRFVGSDELSVGGLAHLVGLPSLMSLHVSHLPGEKRHAVLGHLSSSLTSLTLTHSQAQEDSIAALRTLTSLIALDLSHNFLSGACVEQLGQLPALASLSVAHNEIGFDRTSDHECLRALTALVQLNLDHNPLVSARPWLNGLNATTHLADLRLLTRLESLNLQGFDSGIEDLGLYHLRNMSRLTALSIRNNSITDNGLESLVRSLPRLRRIDIGANELSSDAAKILLANNPRLTSVSASSSALSDSALYYLTRLPTLRTIDMRNTRITEEAIQIMTEHFPYIRLIS